MSQESGCSGSRPPVSFPEQGQEDLHLWPELPETRTDATAPAFASSACRSPDLRLRRDLDLWCRQLLRQSSSKMESSGVRSALLSRSDSHRRRIVLPNSH